jgi:FkbM family methyltransferase
MSIDTPQSMSEPTNVTVPFDLQEHFLNADAVLRARMSGQPLPPLRLRNGQIVHHAPVDPVLELYNEIFVHRVYTLPTFYSPSSNDTVVDCGANIGVCALHLSHLAPGIRIYCFEPCTDTSDRLRANVIANGLQDRVAIFPLALWDSHVTRELTVVAGSNAASLHLSSETSPRIRQTVPCITLSTALSFCSSRHVDLLKIDAEGAELEILQGAATLDWDRVRRVAVEYHGFLRPRCALEVLSLLASYGFSNIYLEGLHSDLGLITATR